MYQLEKIDELRKTMTLDRACKNAGMTVGKYYYYKNQEKKKTKEAQTSTPETRGTLTRDPQVHALLAENARLKVMVADLLLKLSDHRPQSLGPKA